MSIVNTINSKIVLAIEELYRSYMPKKFSLALVQAEQIFSGAPNPGACFRAASGVDAFESHSKRSAWIFKPWSDEHGGYVGYEYKGIGNADGSALRVVNTGVNDVVIGGQRFDWAKQEYETSLAIWTLLAEAAKEMQSKTDSSVAGARYDTNSSARAESSTPRYIIPCQRPIALFRYKHPVIAEPLGIFVRSYASPIRVIDFWKKPWVFEEYLKITGETKDEYARRIGAVAGRALKILFENGYAKPMEIDNTTSEGELLDFEHVWNGCFAGRLSNDNNSPSQDGRASYNIAAFLPYAFEALYVLFRDFGLVFHEENTLSSFYDAFTNAFCKMPIDFTGMGNAEKAYACLEKFFSRPISAIDVALFIPPSIRESLLKSEWQRLEFYRQLKEKLPTAGAPPAGFEDDAEFLRRNIDMLIRITEEDFLRYSDAKKSGDGNFFVIPLICGKREN